MHRQMRIGEQFWPGQAQQLFDRLDGYLTV
jgi:hypothetical protein